MAKGNALPGMQARQNAIQALIEAHQDEFDRILGDEREKLGMPRNPEQARKAAKIAKLREQLKALGYNGEV